MGRPLLGHKKVLIEIPAIHHDQVKEMARLGGSKRGKRVPVNVVFRQLIRDGIDRVSAAL